MTKNELELENLRLQTQSRRFHAQMTAVERTLTLLTLTVIVYLIMDGMTEIVQAEPGAIHALSKVFESLNSILSWAVAVMNGGCWLYTYRGKKRLDTVIEELRKQLEASDYCKLPAAANNHGPEPKMKRRK